MRIEVFREALKPCAFGTMVVDGLFYGYTLERPWLDNRPRVSCIPEGTYKIATVFSPRFQKLMIGVKGVQGREGILIHNANFWHELAGCLAVAKRRHNEEHISQGLAHKLLPKVEAAEARGEAITLTIKNPGAA